MSTPSYTVQTLTRAQVETGIEMAAAEGWNPGLADAQTLHDADPHAFTGCIDEEGQLLACTSIARYGEAHGFLGFYICAPEYRGQGIGYALWQTAMKRAGSIGIALDGVVDQQKNYRRSGFTYAHANWRYGGMPVPLAATDRVLPLDACDPAALAAFDTAVFGMPRPRFLAAWLAQPGAVGGCVVGNGHVRGYALRRPCREGAKIGPLFAEDEGTARALFTALTQDLPGPVFLDTPEPNAAAERLAREAGLSPLFETARMMRGAYPSIDPHRTYGITSFEFG